MKSYIFAALMGFAALVAQPVVAAPVVGEPAPAIVAKDTNGKDFSLEAFKGKVVVLEWTNHGCPFVKKHYESKNMQSLQKEMTDKGVVWVSVVSSAPGKEGHVTAEEANKITTDAGATITAKILDESGVIGKAYDAKTTPHMFVIDAEGKVAYMGAIDSDSGINPEGIKTATNYVRAAVDEVMAGKPVTTKETQPYGCSVKY